MKLLTAVVIIGIVIWYLDFMSPEKKKKRKEKFDAFTKDYEEKIARSKEDSLKKGKSIGHAISTILSKRTKNPSIQKTKKYDFFR
jgi:hypothetical protein